MSGPITRRRPPFLEKSRLIDCVAEREVVQRWRRRVLRTRFHNDRWANGRERFDHGVGGYHLGSAKDQGEAKQIVDQAIDAGINFFDNAWEYHDGVSEEWLGAALDGKRDKVFLMTKVCSHGQDKQVAMRMWRSLCEAASQPTIWMSGNSRSALFQRSGFDLQTQWRGGGVNVAKQQGKIRFVGFTGHKIRPSI